MTTSDGTAVLAEIHNRLTTLEVGMSGASNVPSRVAEIENQTAAVAASISAIPYMASKIYEIEAQVGGMMDAKIAAAVATLTASGGMQAPPQNTSWNARSILESKALQDIDRVVDAK